MALLLVAGICHRNNGFLRDCSWVQTWLPELVQLIGMHPVGEVIVQPYAHWEGAAPSAVLFLEESLVAIHTYPQDEFIQINIDSCNDIPDYEDVVEVITRYFALEVCYQRYVKEWTWKGLMAQHHSGQGESNDEPA